MCTQNTEKCLAQKRRSKWWVIASTEKYVENNQDMIENGPNEKKQNWTFRQRFDLNMRVITLFPSLLAIGSTYFNGWLWRSSRRFRSATVFSMCWTACFRGVCRVLALSFCNRPEPGPLVMNSSPPQCPFTTFRAERDVTVADEVSLRRLTLLRGRSTKPLAEQGNMFV